MSRDLPPRVFYLTKVEEKIHQTDMRIGMKIGTKVVMKCFNDRRRLGRTSSEGRNPSTSYFASEYFLVSEIIRSFYG